MRVFDDMTDIVLDVPNAYHTLTKLMERGVKAGFVSASVAEQVPQRYLLPWQTPPHTHTHNLYAQTYLFYTMEL